MDQMLGDYRVTFGKFRGQRLENIDEAELRDYVDWLEEQLDESPSNYDSRAETFCKKARAYLDGEE